MSKPQGVYVLERYDQLSESVAFGQTLRYSDENKFCVLSNSEMNVTNRAEVEDEKNVVICPASMFSSWIMVLKLLQKMYFLQFCVDLSKKSGPFTYMHLKGLLMHFQKMALLCYDVVFEVKEFR